MSLHLEHHELRCFHAVIVAGSFTRAAERLDVTQSSVSQSIANLEHRLSAILIRRGNPLQLTEAGARLMRYCERALTDERETLQDIEQIRTGALSTLSLALSPATNERIGLKLLREFSTRNPNVRLKVVVAPSREIVDSISEGRWELGFGPSQHAMADFLSFHPFFAEVRRLMIAADHPARATLKSNATGTLLGIPLITSYLAESSNAPGKHRLRDNFGSVWEVSHMDLRLALAAESKGVTYVSDQVANRRKDLVPVDGLPFSSIERQVGLYYLKHQPLSQAGTRFLALCRETWAPPVV